MAAVSLNRRPAPVAAPAQSRPARRRLRRALLTAATVLAFIVVGLGAYVRLSDAGLGCPDWPGCYGQLLGVPEATPALSGQPLHVAKAWKEMIHRYAAGTLGLLVLAIALTAWRLGRRLLAAENGLLLLIALQAALGMWTVTLLLKPVIVTLHLLGGMATWASLVLLLRRDYRPQTPPLASFGRLTVTLVFLQIALGGWVSSNYAALACSDFPSCQHGNWWPDYDFGHGFALLRELGATTSGDLLPLTALTAIHLTHRLGAMLVLLIVGTYGVCCCRQSRLIGGLILGALGLQVALGVGNVLLQLPLPLAVAHNLGAAGLLAILVWGPNKTPLAKPTTSSPQNE